jgi:HK97 family phage major capsid protein
MEVLDALKETNDLVNKRFDRIEQEHDARLKALEMGSKERRVSVSGLEDEKERFSMSKAVIAITTGDWTNAGFEKSVFEETRKKAASVGSDSAGGFIVPIQYLGDNFIELLRPNSTVIQMGATVLNGLVGSPVEIPKQLSGATAYWIDENASITDSQQSYGQLNLRPHSLGAVVILSNRFLRMANPSADKMITQDITKVMALAVDLAALAGTGIGAQPVGIKNTVGVGSLAIGVNGGTFDYVQAQNMEGLLEDANALRGKLGYIMSPAVKRVLKKQKVHFFSGDTKGYPLGVVSDEQLKSYLGYDFMTTTQLPNTATKGAGTGLSTVIFGNFEELILANWGDIEILASKETSNAFTTNQTYIRIIQETDIGIRHAESFAVCNDAVSA